MPTYDYRCADHGVVSVVMSLHEVTDTVQCPSCRRSSRRVYTSPQVRLGDGAARRLLDVTAATADAPAVVSSPVGRRMTSQRQRAVVDPRTARLPRP
jgi:putative FmdB family regulatory protein